MPAKVILNPYAGRWLALKKREELEAALKDSGIDFELVLTEFPDHGISLAVEAVREGFAPIIAAGGDGSISEVVNGMIQADVGDVPPLGVIPLGSANDFPDNLGIPKELGAATEVIASGNTKTIDLGVVKSPNNPERYFDNNAAVGLEPYVTQIQERIENLHGTLRYLVATLKAIYDNPQWSVHLKWEGGEYQGPATLVTVGNLPRTGGIFYMTPDADPQDGLLTFVYGFMATRLQILRLLPRTMKPKEGSYIEHLSIHEIHSSWLKVHTDQPTPAHADGVIFDHAAQDLEYRVLPQILPVLTSK